LTNTRVLRIIDGMTKRSQISYLGFTEAKQMRHGDEFLEVEDMFYVGVALANGL